MRMSTIQCALIGIVAGALIAMPAAAEDIRALSPGDRVADVGMPTWTILWWHWAFSMDQRLSPVRDRTGERCAMNQSGPVWYLSGGFGVDRILRNCTVPKGLHLFFPLINLVQARGNNENITCAEVTQGAAMRNTELLELWLRIDGVDVSDAAMLLSSPDCFDLTARMPRELEVPGQYPAATSGLWVMLAPLPPGKHTLEFGARDTRDGRPNNGIIQDIEYVLTIRGD